MCYIHYSAVVPATTYNKVNPLTHTVAMGTAIKHPVPDRVKLSLFCNFFTRALWRSALSVRVPGCQKLQMTSKGTKWQMTSKTWTPLPDRFIDDHLVEMFPLFDQLVDVTNLAAVHMLLQLLSNLVVDWVKVRTVGWPQSWSNKVWCFMS